MALSLRDLSRRCFAGAAAAAVLAVAPAAAEPALWVVEDEDSTLYLFGTVHVLRPDLEWRSPKIDQALAQSEAVVLEIDSGDDPAALQALVTKYGLDPQRPLSSKLSAQDHARLADSAKAMGLPPESLEPMRPWMAAITVAVVPLIQAGYEPGKGVEAVLTAQAKAAGKPILALETAEQQVRFFADMTPEAEIAMLRSALDDVAAGPAKLDELVAAWASGDVALMEAVFIEEMRSDYPDLYEALLTRRNQDWADQIVKALEGSGVRFYAVGAGHLVGPDSVQAELAKRGVTAARR